jgi:hypothetical protein
MKGENFLGTYINPKINRQKKAHFRGLNRGSTEQKLPNTTTNHNQERDHTTAMGSL